MYEIELKLLSMLTVADWIELCTILKNLGLQALHDMILLPDMARGHPDRKVFVHKRVTLKSQPREPFMKLLLIEQDTYTYRTAGSETSRP